MGDGVHLKKCVKYEFYGGITMTYIVKFINAKKENPCGSEWTRIIKDLKTIRGVENRITRGVKPVGAVGYNIYQTANIYDEKSYRLMQKVYFTN